MKKEKVAILVSCHKPFLTAKNAIIKPIQVGAVFTEQRFDGMLYDDQGDNISIKNKRYCELTAQYYAYKNIDAEYYGFFHYRRYLSFASRRFLSVPFMSPKMDVFEPEKVKKLLKLDEQNLEKKIFAVDAVLPKKMTILCGNYNWYKKSKGHYIRDLDFCFDYVKENYPKIYPYVLKHKRARSSFMCNMFVLKKQYFNDYCEFLFDVLSAHEQKYDCKDYDTYAYRVSGFLSERLFDIYMRFLIAEKKIKVKKVQCVAFKNVPTEK